MICSSFLSASLLFFPPTWAKVWSFPVHFLVPNLVPNSGLFLALSAEKRAENPLACDVRLPREVTIVKGGFHHVGYSGL